MSDFERLFNPTDVTPPIFPEGFESWGHTGKPNLAGINAVGRQWEESYGIMQRNDPNFWQFIAYLNKLRRTKTIFDISHLHRLTPTGVPVDNIYAYGANQTGSTLQVSKNPSGSQVAVSGTLKRGDLIKIAGINLVFDVDADVSNFTAIPISPMLVTGMSHAAYAVVTYTAVKFRAVLSGDFEFPKGSGRGVYAGLTLNFRECP